MPGAGIVVVEANGGSVWIAGADGIWHRRRRGEDIVIDLMGSIPSWPRMPGSRRSSRCPTVRAGRSATRTVWETLAGRLWDVATQEAGHRVPDHDDVDLIVDLLRGRMLP